MFSYQNCFQYVAIFVVMLLIAIELFRSKREGFSSGEERPVITDSATESSAVEAPVVEEPAVEEEPVVVEEETVPAPNDHGRCGLPLSPSGSLRVQFHPWANEVADEPMNRGPVIGMISATGDLI